MLRHVTLGFSKFGFLVAVLQLLPNVLWVLFPPAQDPLAGSRSSLPGLEFGEHVLGIALVVMLIFLVSRRESEPLIPAGLCGKVSLGAIALYWLGWACYFSGWQSSFIIYSLVILPPAAFFFAGLAKRVLPITIACLVFLVFHFAVTLESFPLW